jgi:hypothetical protein
MMSISGSGGRSELDTASRVVAQMPTSGFGSNSEKVTPSICRPLFIQYGLNSDITTCLKRANLGSAASPDHFVGDRQHRRWKFETQRCSSLSIEHQLEFGLLLERDFVRLRTSQNLACHVRKAAH